MRLGPRPGDPPARWPWRDGGLLGGAAPPDGPRRAHRTPPCGPSLRPTGGCVPLPPISMGSRWPKRLLDHPKLSSTAGFRIHRAPEPYAGARRSWIPRGQGTARILEVLRMAEDGTAPQHVPSPALSPQGDEGRAPGGLRCPADAIDSQESHRVTAGPAPVSPTTEDRQSTRCPANGADIWCGAAATLVCFREACGGVPVSPVGTLGRMQGGFRVAPTGYVANASTP